MKGTLKLEDGRELAVEIDENALKSVEEPKKKTGYERVDYYERYYYEADDRVGSHVDGNDEADHGFYNSANYYSDESVARHNARADTLMRRLRRFAVEHRTKELDWNDSHENKYYIAYDHDDKQLIDRANQIYQSFGRIYFDSEETAKAAIEEFKDELIWYFTEYRNSL